MDNLFGEFDKIDTVEYYKNNNDIKSDIYLNKKLDSIVIIDKNICMTKFEEPFSYREYTNYQNRLMKKHRYLYRFLEKDIELNINKIRDIINGRIEIPLVAQKNIKREGIDASYLEHHFENMFMEFYGDESYNFLKKEAKIIGFNGENIFADYLIEKRNESIVIEENGENYHHPQKTGEERYKKQIERQNALVYQDYKVFRFSKNEIEFKDRMLEEMEIFFGRADEFILQNRIEKKREFKLYDHQEVSLKNLKIMREQEIQSTLIVLPTGTGKSMIAIHDIDNYLKKNGNKKVLIISPTKPLRDKWIKDIKDNIEKISV
ncbi:MAG: DEAD/DEAH box helicase family protein, partial [Fusobacteriaceae bacterium]